MSSCNSSERHDRLSELPDSLILSILSFLSMFDVVRTTILSKRWKDLWVTIPRLHFIIRDPHFRYVDFIDGALAQWRGAKMLKFYLDLSLSHHRPFLDSYIDSWLLFAIEKQVEEFSIDLCSWSIDYVAPQRLYSCSSIKKLSLSFIKLEIEDKVQWNNLKSLTIRAFESLSEDAMNQVLSGAPHLEELILTYYREVSADLNIRSTSLKTFQIDVFNETHTKVLGAMIEGCMNSSSPNVELLRLRLYNVRKAEVTTEIFPLSKKLVIKVEDADRDPMTYLGIEENLPTSFVLQLRRVEYVLVKGDIIFPCLEFLLKNASKLEKIVFRVKVSVQHSRRLESLFRALRKLLKMPRSSRTAEFTFCEY